MPDAANGDFRHGALVAHQTDPAVDLASLQFRTTSCFWVEICGKEPQAANFEPVGHTVFNEHAVGVKVVAAIVAERHTRLNGKSVFGRDARGRVLKHTGRTQKRDEAGARNVPLRQGLVEIEEPAMDCGVIGDRRTRRAKHEKCRKNSAHGRPLEITLQDNAHARGSNKNDSFPAFRIKRRKMLLNLTSVSYRLLLSSR